MRFRDAARRGGRLVLAHLRGRAVPFHVTLSVTQRCNQRCVYCSRPDEVEPELAAAEWCGVLAELRRLGTERVVFFGGEPLVRDDLAQIVAHARALGLRCALTTNGTLVPQRREVVTMLQTLIVSLDGDAAAHDRNRGKGSHARALAAIEAARAWSIPAKVNAVLNANNAQSLDWLLEFCQSRRLPLTLNIMRSEISPLGKNAAEHRLSDRQVRALLGRIIAAKDTSRCIVFSKSTFRRSGQWPDFARDRIIRAEAGARSIGPPCSAGRFHCIIQPDGRLFPCVVTVGRVPALDVRQAGVAGALDLARRHGCAACHAPCLLEVNALFGLRPGVLLGLARTYLGGRME